MVIIHNFASRRNGIVECACGRSYTPHDDADVEAHALHHAEFERVCRIQNHVPAPFSERERMKDAGRSALREAVTEAEVRTAAEMLVHGWFDRSLMRAIEHGFGALHPTLAEYTAMLVADRQLESRACAVLARALWDLRTSAGRLDATIWEPVQFGEGATIS